MISGVLLLKAAMGAGVVLLISWLAGSGIYFLIGLAPLFPTFALIGHFSAWSAGGVDAIKSAALFGMASLIPYYLYLIAVYFLADKVGLITTLSAAIAIWAMAALILIKAWGIEAG